jgi:TRAP-type C4-dicarboxylate transport system substrate-binding protein
MKKILSGLALAVAASAYSGTAAAADATLSAASCFPKGTYFSKAMEKFVPSMNEANAGVKINYVGGAPAIGSPFTLVQKASKGVYGLVSCTGAYYQNVLTEVDAMKLAEKSNEELRKNGGFALMDKLHREKGLHFLGRIGAYIPFHLYLSKKIDKPDLTGLHLRVAPIYTAFFTALGATTQRSTIAEVYTYMENGTVAGYGWPVTGLLPDWHKVTKYRVDPGFYDADINLVIHLDTWEKLTAAQQKALGDMAIKYEGLAQGFKKEAVDAVADQKSKGIEAITFTGADAEKWLSTAREAGWASVIKNSPQHGPELKKLFTN